MHSVTESPDGWGLSPCYYPAEEAVLFVCGLFVLLDVKVGQPQTQTTEVLTLKREAGTGGLQYIKSCIYA